MNNLYTFAIMDTAVIFRIDEKLKRAAMRRADQKGFSYSAFLKFATKAFVKRQLDIGVTQREIPNTRTARRIDRALQDYKSRKNIAGPFSTADEIMAHLRRV